ncbi:hypothetical protein Hanom_Chr04g00340961 [Helianthus anomalus]
MRYYIYIHNTVSPTLQNLYGKLKNRLAVSAHSHTHTHTHIYIWFKLLSQMD